MAGAVEAARNGKWRLVEAGRRIAGGAILDGGSAPDIAESRYEYKEKWRVGF